MNFYGHAFVAAEASRDPRFLFGSMLPDFCTMVGARLEGVAEAQGEVARGVEHHHATDEVFHAAPVFVELMGWGRDALEQAGVGLGPAMAVGHVGVELLLDAWLWREGARIPYEEALACADGVHGALRLHKQADPRAILRLTRRLAELQVHADDASPQTVADRLQRILAPRPRLALDDHAHGAVVAWLDEAQARVDAEAPSLMAQVRAGLSDHPST